MTKHALFTAMLITLATGCEDAVRKSAELRPVSGNVTINGEPCRNAKVLFVPIQVTDAQRAYLEPSHATTDEEGNFTLESHSGRGGACIGRHMVWISTRSDEQHDLPPRPPSRSMETDIGIQEETIPPRYNVNTELYFDVEREGENRADFELSR